MTRILSLIAKSSGKSDEMRRTAKTGIGEINGDPMNLRFATDIDSVSRLVENQGGWLRGKPFRERDFLAVPPESDETG